LDKNLIQRTISGLVYVAVIILCTTPLGAKLINSVSPGLVKQEYLYYGMITLLLGVGSWECVKIMKFGDGYEKWVVCLFQKVFSF
jgi:phosphatidate cytidylyltransferase